MRSTKSPYVFTEGSLHEVNLIRIKTQNCAHMYAGHTKYVVNQKLEHDELLERSEYCCKIRIVPSQDNAFVCTLTILFYEAQLD